MIDNWIVTTAPLNTAPQDIDLRPMKTTRRLDGMAIVISLSNSDYMTW